jgi:hypothetical protein
MARPPHKTPDELMKEAFWSRMDICRLFRKAPRTIDRYIYHPDPKKRLPGLIVNGEFYAEKSRVLAFFRHKPGNGFDDDVKSLGTRK